MIGVLIVSQVFSLEGVNVLEVSYYRRGSHQHIFFEWPQPLSSKARLDPDSTVIRSLYSYYSLVKCLSEDFRELKQHYPYDESIFYIYRGPIKKALLDAGITDILEISSIGIPSIFWLEYIYPNLKESSCPFHLNGKRRCTERIMKLIYLFSCKNSSFVDEQMKKRKIEIDAKGCIHYPPLDKNSNESHNKNQSI